MAGGLGACAVLLAGSPAGAAPAAGATPGNGPSSYPSISDDGRYVAFAAGAAYLAQFAGGLGDVLVDAKTTALFRAKGDVLAKQKCPVEYRKFLQQAEISSIRAPG